jgi:hypothetical protein
MDSETKALVKVGQPTPVASIDDLGKLGSWLAKSGMFGCDRPEQGVVLALACHTTGMNPIELKENYHLIDGNLSKRSDAMLASLIEHGGEYEIKSRTADKAEIAIACGKAKGTFSLSWDEAKEEPFVWSKKKNREGKPILKTNYATPRARMQMLWARVVSDGVRTCCPQAVQGCYTPEELRDLNDSPRGEIVIPPEQVEVQKPDGKTVTQPPEAKPEPKPEPKPEEGKTDYTCMPIGRLAGTHFKELSIEQLKLDEKEHPQVTKKHKANAANWLKKKEKATVKVQS